MNREYNGGEWSAARFHSFIKSALRNASLRWPPRLQAKKKAWISRGLYLCAGYRREPHQVRAKDLHIDHIHPVISPEDGFVSWDETIDRMMCEVDGFQALCTECHSLKSSEERKIRKR